MNYGFVINNDTCIGCHACSTACKSENAVPLGVHRTWVKSVETGEYPNVRRSFQVTRCNHCANPPCVRICPVTAMYQRQDGIVEFDPDVCIGCKACMQACPYDAIYVDPDTGSIAKCHYCAHRVEVGIEPACVVVCPEHAIIAGDLDDPRSEISRAVAANRVTVRRPEQGTAPKLFYIGGADAALHPTATGTKPTAFAWSDVVGPHGGDGRAGEAPRRPASRRRSSSGTPIRTPGAQGVPSPGPIMIGEGRMAEQMVQVTWNAQHRVAWHWPVPAYLVTKGIATGIFMLLGLGWLLGGFPFAQDAFLAGGLLSIVFTLLTTALLVYDLEHPGRFLRILLRPQSKSWLVRGAFLLVAFSTVSGLWWVIELAALRNLVPMVLAETIREPVFWIGVPLALGAAVYTAFLFGQAEGRDLWQNGLLPAHLVVQAAVAGAGALLAMHWAWPVEATVVAVVRPVFIAAVTIDLLLLAGEVWMPHASDTAARAAHEITHGRYRARFWLAAIGLGHVVPLALAFAPGSWGAGLAGLVAIAGLYAYEYCFVMAPQEVPNS
jgi:Fe-S-cluster-containing dehydrogenase component/formate-dependent nitrite reductase membrane component NrfD